MDTLKTQIKNTDYTDTYPISRSPSLHVSLSHFLLLLALFIPLFPCSPLYSLEIPLDFHGRGFIGKYMYNNSIRYNMDASVELYCTFIRHNNISFFMHYRDDLDMARQTGGVTLDPRYSHYYIVGGFDLIYKRLLLATYFMHDCVHDIDYDVEETPVFNRFRFMVASADFHPSQCITTNQKFLWSIDLGWYPHWDYHGFDVNAGADFHYDVILELVYSIFKNNAFGVDFNPVFQTAKGDTSFYHKHTLRLMTYYRNNDRRVGIGLDYNIKDNDPIKNPEKLWLLSIFAEF